VAREPAKSWETQTDPGGAVEKLGNSETHNQANQRAGGELRMILTMSAQRKTRKIDILSACYFNTVVERREPEE
ncbi:uncharacterized protein METZ01_LOCUS201126, partial [marine metagenome]